MTPKEKAEDLLFKFSEWNATYNASIAVDEILSILDYPSDQYHYYLEVKKEIEKHDK